MYFNNSSFKNDIISSLVFPKTSIEPKTGKSIKPFSLTK